MQATAPWFRKWFSSPYYHRLYFKRDQAEAADFITHLLDHLKPAPGARMLDMACGRGRHCIQLASGGYDVTGIDLSEENIIEARKQEKENLHFFTHDMRLPFWINYFDFAFNFFTSFGYFDTRREHDNAVRTISQSVKPGGVFVLDYLNVHFEEDHLVPRSGKQMDGVHYDLTKWFDETHFYKKIVVEDPSLDGPLEYMEKVTKFTLGDFTEMLAYRQMQVQEVFGDYRFGTYDVKKSPRMILIAKKITR